MQVQRFFRAQMRLFRAQTAQAGMASPLVVALAARGFGKTHLSLHLAAQAALAAPAGDQVLWVTPVRDQFRQAWREMTLAYAAHLARRSAAETRCEWRRSGALEFRSAYDPDRLRGKTYRAVIVDEASLLPAQAWQSCIRPTQRRAHDWAVLLTTPRGWDWIAGLYRRRLSERAAPPLRLPAAWPLPAGGERFAASVDSARVREAREQSPADVFEREYQCAWLDSPRACFHNVAEKLEKSWPQREELTGPFVIGVDWGLNRDFTAACVVDLPSGRIAKFARVRRVASQWQFQMVAELAREFQDAFCLCDATSMQDQAIGALRQLQVLCMGFVFGTTSKAALIEHLLIGWERGAVRLPPYEPLVKELQAFESGFSSQTRQRTYRAPSDGGAHDDCVIALALAWWARTNRPEAGMDEEGGRKS
ncbi:MAG: terminase large subunit domain-containing protein [Planctomycetota bacterium]